MDAMKLLMMLESMIIQACGERYGVRAIAIAGVGEDGVLVDAHMVPLTLALAWFDPLRAQAFGAFQAQLSADVDLGVADEPSRTLAGWHWARHQPGAQHASAWLALTDFVASHWAGTPFMSDTLAARTGAWDVRAGRWVEPRVRLCLGSMDLLPKVRRTGDCIGSLRSSALQAAGVLFEDARVVVGGHDHPIGGWGVSQMQPGAILDSMGTAEVVVAQATLRITRGENVDVCAGIRSHGTTLLSVQELSRNVAWASEDPEVKVALRAIITGSQTPDEYVQSDCFVPGGRGGVAPMFTDQVPRRALSRASAVAGALSRLGNASVEQVAQHMAPDALVFCAGGWARSRGWIDLKRSLGSREIKVVAEPEVTAVGAALLCAQAVGWDLDAEVALAADPIACSSRPAYANPVPTT
ncbi:Xylulo kinase [Pseudomonas syringae pv. avellanae str. ISPaVe013]|nr:Xylulo kinase [Pseudomonas syringae pv. avellanae str. ISPaVe013]